jgi:hypothetical protein
MRRMQEERTPFVGAQYIAPAGASSNGQGSPPVELHGEQPYEYTGPLELQGAGRPEPLPAQQLDGYTAAVGAIFVESFNRMERLICYSQRSMRRSPSSYLRMLW